MSYFDPRIDPSCQLYLDFYKYGSGVKDDSVYNRGVTILNCDERFDLFELDTTEHIINGTFQNTSNWTPNNCNFSVSNNKAVITPTTVGVYGYISQLISTLTADSIYLFRCTLYSPDYLTCKVTVNSSYNQIIERTDSISQVSLYVPFMPKSNYCTINIGAIGASGGGLVYATDVSIRKINSRRSLNGLSPKEPSYMLRGPKVSDLNIGSEHTIITWVTLLNGSLQRQLFTSTSPFISLSAEYQSAECSYTLSLSSGTYSASCPMPQYYVPVMFACSFKEDIGIQLFQVSDTLNTGGLVDCTGPMTSGDDYFYVGLRANSTIFHEVTVYNKFMDVYDIIDYYNATKSKYPLE